MRTDEDTSPPVRHANRWKRWIGYYLVLGGSFAIIKEMPRMSWPLHARDVIYLSVEVIVVAWGVYWIVLNPKAKDQPASHGGRIMIVALAIVLFAVLLTLYQVFFSSN